MAKAELGLKRLCVSCATRFYDLGKTPAACPKCGAVQPAEQPRVRRGGNVVDLRKPKKVAVAEDAEAETEADAEVEGEEAEDGVLEDASDLEDDEDDALATELEVEPDGDEPER